MHVVTLEVQQVGNEPESLRFSSSSAAPSIFSGSSEGKRPVYVRKPKKDRAWRGAWKS